MAVAISGGKDSRRRPARAGASGCLLKTPDGLIPVWNAPRRVPSCPRRVERDGFHASPSGGGVERGPRAQAIERLEGLV